MKFGRCVGCVWYLGRYVDWLQLLSLTSVGVFSLVGVSAVFGNLGGMLMAKVSI